MPRCTKFGLTSIALLFVLALSAAPALAEEAMAPQAALPAVAASSPVLANCGGGAGLTGLAAQGEICPAVQPENPAPEFMAKPPRIRYCSCGCGATCTTDADCDGGVCISVITCC